MNRKLLLIIPIQYITCLVFSYIFKNDTYFKSKDPSYFEKSTLEYLREPLNSFSNFSYILIPYFLLKKKEKIKYPIYLVTAGSFCLHSIGSSFGADLDRIGMISVVSWLSEINVKYKNMSIFYTFTYTILRFLKFINSYSKFIDSKYLKLFTYKEPYTILLSYRLASLFKLHNNNLVKIIICIFIRIFDLIYSVSGLKFNENINYNRSIFILKDIYFIMSNSNKLKKAKSINSLIGLFFFIIGAFLRKKSIGDIDLHSFWHLFTALSIYFGIP